MPSSYTPSLRLVLPVQGELTGSWGTTVNNGLTSLVDAAIAGTATVSMTDANYTLTAINESADQARQMFIRLTGTLSATRNVICPAVSKLYFVSNETTGGQSIVFKTSSGTGITVPNGKSIALYCNGTNVLNAFNLANADLVGNVTGSVTGNVTGNASTATTLQTARNINGVSFNGSANITVTASTTNAITFNNSGSGVASGTTFDGGTARTISYNTIGAPKADGTGASGTWGIDVSGNAATVTNGVYTTGDQTIDGTKTFSASPVVPDASFGLAKLQTVSTGTVLGRSTSGTGAVESLSTLPAVNGSAVTNLNASNLASGTVATARLASGTANNTTFLRGDQTWADFKTQINASGDAPIYACRAWVNFNGTGTVAIRFTGNVSSITDNGTGDYTVNFTTAMPDSLYSMVGTCNARSGHPTRGLSLASGATPSSSSVRVTTGSSGGSGVTGIIEDCEYVYIAFFR